MDKDYFFKSLDLSIITQYDLFKIYPKFYPLVISYNSIDTENYSQEDYRILGLICYAENYNIKDLSTKLKQLFKGSHSYLF